MPNFGPTLIGLDFLELNLLTDHGVHFSVKFRQFQWKFFFVSIWSRSFRVEGQRRWINVFDLKQLQVIEPDSREFDEKNN